MISGVCLLDENVSAFQLEKMQNRPFGVVSIVAKLNRLPILVPL